MDNIKIQLSHNSLFPIEDFIVKDIRYIATKDVKFDIWTYICKMIWSKVNLQVRTHVSNIIQSDITKVRLH